MTAFQFCNFWMVQPQRARTLGQNNMIWQELMWNVALRIKKINCTAWDGGLEAIHLKTSLSFWSTIRFTQAKSVTGPTKILTQSWASQVYLVHVGNTLSVPWVLSPVGRRWSCIPFWVPWFGKTTIKIGICAESYQKSENSEKHLMMKSWWNSV